MYITCVFLLSGCGIDSLILYWCGHPQKDFRPEWQQAKFYEGKHTGLGAKIHLEGYYLCKDHNYMMPPQMVLFYEDGTGGDLIFKDTCLYLKGKPQTDLAKSIDMYDGIWSGGFCYEVRNDTIIADNYFVSGAYWNLCRYKFKIISRDTIEMVGRKSLSKYEPDYGDYNDHWQYVFVPAINLPNPDSVLIKQKKWIWRDEKDWKAFQTKHKRKR